MRELNFIEKAFEFGFAAIVALLLIAIIWKLSQRVIESFEKITASHKEDITSLADEHRKERKECYANQEKQISKFDETIRLVSNNNQRRDTVL